MDFGAGWVKLAFLATGAAKVFFDSLESAAREPLVAFWAGVAREDWFLLGSAKFELFAFGSANADLFGLGSIKADFVALVAGAT